MKDYQTQEEALLNLYLKGEYPKDEHADFIAKGITLTPLTKDIVERLKQEKDLHMWKHMKPFLL